MRVSLTVLAALLAACGGSSGKPAAPKSPAFAAGAKVRISDGGQIYDALNTTECVKWPSPAVKKKAGRDGWAGFNPGSGVAGKVLAALAHCDGQTQVVLVEVGAYVVPVTSKGVEAADAGDQAMDEVVGTIGFDPGALGGLGYGAFDGYDASYDGYGGYGYGGLIGGVAGGVVASGTFYEGDPVEIVDVGEIFTDANDGDCFTWPSDDVKQRGGQSSWGSYTPAKGDAGVVVHVTQRCSDSVPVLILDVGGYIVPIKASAVTLTY